MNIQKLVEMRDEDFREFIAECEKQAAELEVNLDYFMEEWICDWSLTHSFTYVKLS